MASHDVEYVIYYLLTGSAHCSLGLRWVLDPLFQSLATHTCVHTHINTHTHTHSILYRTVEDAEVVALFAISFTCEVPIHIYSVCPPGVFQAL